jgi:hypothetical protein
MAVMGVQWSGRVLVATSQKVGRHNGLNRSSERTSAGSKQVEEPVQCEARGYIAVDVAAGGSRGERISYSAECRSEASVIRRIAKNATRARAGHRYG